MSSRRKTSLATVQRSGEDLEVKSVRFDDGIYTECADSENEELASLPELDKMMSPEAADAPASPPLPMSPLTSESQSSSSEESDEDEGEEQGEDVDDQAKAQAEEEIQVIENEDNDTSRNDEDHEQSVETELPSTPFTRNYSCAVLDCSFHTQNPRTYLYHLRDEHAAKGKIYECKYCVYASNHSQKVNRHIDKCHPSVIQPVSEQEHKPPHKLVKPEPFQFLKNLLLKEKEEKAAAASAVKSESSRSDDEKSDEEHKQEVIKQVKESIEEDGTSSSEDDDSDEGTTDSSDEEADGDDKETETGGGADAEETDEDVEDEEADVPDSNENNAAPGGDNLQCTICNYSTRIRSRFTKHVRYHSMPLIKCMYCDFRSPYKWNLERHYKSHNYGMGNLHCPLCNFSSNIKQSITVHIQNHHENLTPVRVLELVQSLDKGAGSCIAGFQETSQTLASPPQRQVLKIVKSEEYKVTPSMTITPINSSLSLCQANANELIDKNGQMYVKKFKCKYCSFKAIWESELNLHLRRTHGMASRIQPTSEESCNAHSMTRKRSPDKTSALLCPNVMYSFGQGIGGKTETSEPEGVANCEYCSEQFSSSQELIIHQSSCLGLAKIQEWNGGLLWNGNNDEFDGCDESSGKRNLDISNEAITTKKKVYKCPHHNCQFWAITASRFHVHMVGHSNSKPFECSLCFYKSNWRWDIAKHIKLKSQRDSEHLTAKVLLTHESGERNYKEYDQYITLMKVKHSADLKLPDCSTKADKRDDIETELADDFADEVSDIPGEIIYSPSTEDMNIKDSGVSQHSFLKPTFGAPRRLGRNNFLRDLGTSRRSLTNLISTSPGNSLRSSTSTSVSISSSRNDLYGFENSSPPSKLLKMTEPTPVPIIWKCKKCSFRHTSKEAVFTHLRQSHNMRKNASVSILKNNFPLTPKSDESEPLDWFDTLAAKIGGKESHQYMFNEDGGYSCKFCPFATMILDTIIIHAEHHFSSLNRSFSCDFCSFSISSQEALDDHLLLHKAESESKIVLPETKLPRFLKQQFNSTSPSNTSKNQSSKRFSCLECPYVTDSRGQWNYHNQFHTMRDSLYKCPDCSYNVSHKHLLHQHVRVHQKTPLLPREEIAAPMNENSGDLNSMNQIIICELCPSRFLNVNDLQIHSVFHERQSAIQCLLCSYSVRKPLHLQAHERVHTLEYQHRTDELMGQFQLSPTATLAASTRVRFQEGDDEACEGNPEFQYPTHVKNGKLKEKRYKCKKCPSAFEKRDQYKVHISLHGSGQQYQCPVPECDYGVRFYANFIQHLKKHRSQPGVPQELLVAVPMSKRTGPNEFSGSKMDFLSSNTLKRKAANFTCEYCDYETKQKHLMDDHKAVMHPDEEGQSAQFDEYTQSSESNSNSEGELNEADELGIEYDEEAEGFGSGNDGEDEPMDEGIISNDDQKGDEDQQYDEIDDEEDGGEEESSDIT